MQISLHQHMEKKVKADFFYPKSVAIFGSSERRGHFFIHSLINNNFNGPIYSIHPAKRSGAGLPFFKTLNEVPDPTVDNAIIAVPAELVLSCLQDAERKGVKCASIFSSGFSEAGAEGKKLENNLKEFLKTSKIRVVGPNCMGIYCPKSGLAFRTDSKQIDVGSVSFVSQSGGIAINLILRGQKQSLLFSKVVSTGNGIDLTPADFLEFYADDPETKVIGAYLENLGKTPEEGRKLFNALKYANQKKPVIIWRGGRTSMGAKAAASHTGALASNNLIWDAVIKQTGIISVHNFEELVDTLLAFQIVKPSARPKGSGVGLVSVSGGEGVTDSDLLAEFGLTIPRFTEETIKLLEKDNSVASVGVSPANPVDLGTSYFAFSVVDNVIKHLVMDPNINSVIVEISNHYVYNAALLTMNDFSRLFMEQILKTVKEIRRKVDKPILLTMPIIAYEQERLLDRDFFVRNKIAVFDTVEAAGKSIANLLHYETFVKSLPAR